MLSSILTLSLALSLHLAGLAPDSVPAAGTLAHPHLTSDDEHAAFHQRQQVTRRALTDACGKAIQARRAKRSQRELARFADADEMLGLSHMETFQKRMLEDLVQRQDANASAMTNTSTTILDPQVTQGPYHILGELYRQNVTENQGGIPITYEVDFVDVNTCQPLANAWVDTWSANATGFYSGYLSSDLAAQLKNGQSLDVPGLGTINPNGTFANGTKVDVNNFSVAVPADTNEAFLRGVWRTDSDGHLKVHSVVPGWYAQRSTHLHLKVYSSESGRVADNGTFIATGNAHHTGQFFFADEFMALVAEEHPYSDNKLTWKDSLKNTDDAVFPRADANGNHALVDLQYDAKDLKKGVIATTVVGVNASFQSVEAQGAPTWKGYDGKGSTNDTAQLVSSGAGTTTTTNAGHSNSARRSLSLFWRH